MRAAIVWRPRLVLFLLLSAFCAGCEKAKAPPPPAKPVVGIVTIRATPVSIITELTGRTTVFRTADVRPQVNGLIEKRLFVEGQFVQPDQVLYQIDPAPYQASLESAKATLAHARAEVLSDRATVDRYRPLAAALAVSQQDLDTAVATLGAAEADIESGRAGIKSAEINLAYTRVTSPIAGQTGRSSVTEGALVTASQTTSLVTVTQLNPIYVDVTESSATLLRLKRELASGQIRSHGKNAAQVNLILEDGSAYDQPGTLQFSEVVVDQTTDSVTVRAIFPNDQGLLLPGMFVRETINEGILQKALLVPQRGVTHDLKGQATALVVGTDNKVALRNLVTDQAIGDAWLVTSGLVAGDRVIVEGVQMVQPGMAVTTQEVSPDLVRQPEKAADPSSGQNR